MVNSVIKTLTGSKLNEYQLYDDSVITLLPTSAGDLVRQLKF